MSQHQEDIQQIRFIHRHTTHSFSTTRRHIDLAIYRKHIPNSFEHIITGNYSSQPEIQRKELIERRNRLNHVRTIQHLLLADSYNKASMAKIKDTYTSEKLPPEDTETSLSLLDMGLSSGFVLTHQSLDAYSAIDSATNIQLYRQAKSEGRKPRLLPSSLAPQSRNSFFSEMQQMTKAFGNNNFSSTSSTESADKTSTKLKGVSFDAEAGYPQALSPTPVPDLTPIDAYPSERPSMSTLASSSLHEFTQTPREFLDSAFIPSLISEEQENYEPLVPKAAYSLSSLTTFLPGLSPYSTAPLSHAYGTNYHS